MPYGKGAGGDGASGTDRRKQGSDLSGGPVIILVRPQLGENIGTAARAMMNCGLTEMRLVAPRDDWPNPKAVAAASGADDIVEGAAVFDDVPAAIADLTHVYATTARRRDMFKEVVGPRAAAAEIAAAGEGSRIGILFGPEAKGLNNDDVTLAGKIIEAPLNPHHSSLNLAQAVLLVAWEWRMTRIAEPEAFVAGMADQYGEAGALPAPQADLIRLFEHLEAELDESGFLWPEDKRPVMVRNLRNMLQRAQLTEQEVRTLRGVVKSLATLRGERRGRKKGR